MYRQKRTHIIEQTFANEGYTLHYRDVGAGPPLVLIHGYGVSGQIWQSTLPYLAQQHRVLIVDLPGYGHSRHTGIWQLRRIAPLLASWLEQQGLSEVDVLGQSMGGAIAIHLAAYAPDLVRRLVLVSAAGLPLQAQLPTLALRSLHSFLQPGNGRYPLALVRDVLPPRIRLLWQGAQEMVRSDFRAELATLTMPMLIIWGERDALLPISLGYELSKALPHAQFVTLPHSGHRPMLSQPEEFSRLILEFLT